MIRLTERTSVPEAAIELHFVRSPGAGGQHVNKVETAVQLRFGLGRAGLAPALRERLERLAGSRLTQGGEIVIEAHRHRSQHRNREEAFERLAELVERAERVPKARVATRPSRAAKARRTDAKTRRGNTKRMRRAPRDHD